jgi:hypothetical protein
LKPKLQLIYTMKSINSGGKKIYLFSGSGSVCPARWLRGIAVTTGLNPLVSGTSGIYGYLVRWQNPTQKGPKKIV